MRLLRILVILLMVSPAFAQPGPGMGHGREGGPMREKIREKIQLIKVWRLTEAVGLTPKQSEGFFPVYNEHRERLENFETEKREMLERIRSLTNDPNSPDDDISSAINDFMGHHRRMAEMHELFLTDISKILSIRQRGELVVFEEEFRKNMRRMIEDIRREFRGGPGVRRKQ